MGVCLNCKHVNIQGRRLSRTTLPAYPKRNLVLDLDATLVHSVVGWHHQRDLALGNLSVFFRPHLKEFLRQASNKWTIWICTQGARNYAEGIVKALDPLGTLIGDRIVAEQHPTPASKSLACFPFKARTAVVIDDLPVWQTPCPLILIHPFSISERTEDTTLYSMYKILDHCYKYRNSFQALRELRVMMFNDITFRVPPGPLADLAKAVGARVEDGDDPGAWVVTCIRMHQEVPRALFEGVDADVSGFCEGALRYYGAQ